MFGIDWETIDTYKTYRGHVIAEESMKPLDYLYSSFYVNLREDMITFYNTKSDMEFLRKFIFDANSLSKLCSDSVCKEIFLSEF